MLQVGQEVVLMSAAGRFRIVAIEGNLVTLENDLGVRRKVFDQAVRVVPTRNGTGKTEGSA